MAEVICIFSSSGSIKGVYGAVEILGAKPAWCEALAFTFHDMFNTDLAGESFPTWRARNVQRLRVTPGFDCGHFDSFLGCSILRLGDSGHFEFDGLRIEERAHALECEGGI